MRSQVICLWLPNWPCQRFRVTTRDELKNQPFALQARDPRRGWRIMAADPLARQHGIRPGMSLGEATARFASLRLFDYDPQEDIEALVELAQSAWRFSPIVGLERLDDQPWAGRWLHQPQGFFLDATGLTDFFGGTQAMLDLMTRWLSENGYVGQLALASTVGRAWASANYGLRHQVLAKLLADSPDQPCDSPLIHPSLETLDRLPVEALRLSLKTVEILHQLAIRTIGELSSLPRSGLANRLGDQLLQRLDAVREERPEPIHSLKETLADTVEWRLEIPTDRRETLAELLRRLTEQLCHQLRRKNHGALRLIASFQIEQGPAHLLSLGLYRPTADVRHLTKLLLGLLESQSMPRVTGIALTAPLTAPLVWQQPSLFDLERQRYQDTAAHLIDSLAGRLGRRQVLAAHEQNDPLPERAVRWRPLTGQRLDGERQSTRRKLPRSPVDPTAPRPDDPCRRPLHLWQPPAPLEVVESDPSGGLLAFVFQKQIHRPHRQWGPERIESGWWDGATHRRDYYRIETDLGAWLWIYHDLKTKIWYLHGTF